MRLQPSNNIYLSFFFIRASFFLTCIQSTVISFVLVSGRNQAFILHKSYMRYTAQSGGAILAFRSFYSIEFYYIISILKGFYILFYIGQSSKINNNIYNNYNKFYQANNNYYYYFSIEYLYQQTTKIYSNNYNSNISLPLRDQRLDLQKEFYK